ncbi:hypothetical protein JOM56_014809 [Amanita muscaria]
MTSLLSSTSSNYQTFVYKLIPSSSPPPDTLPLKFPSSALDEASGSIRHLSTGVQVPGTLHRFSRSNRKSAALGVINLLTVHNFDLAAIHAHCSCLLMGFASIADLIVIHIKDTSWQ